MDGTEFDGAVHVLRVRVRDHGWSGRTFSERHAALMSLLLRLHEAAPYDVVHDVGGFLYGEVFRDFVLHTGVPGITHLLLLMEPYLTAAGIDRSHVAVFHDLQTIQCGVSSAVVTTSAAESQLYRRLFAACPAPEIMIPNAVPELRPNAERMIAWRETLSGDGAILLFFGGRSGDTVKGGDRASRLVDALKRHDINARLISTNLRISSGEPGWGGDSVQCGRLSEADLVDLLAAVDVVVCPCRYEAFGLLTLEAGAIGTPVLASRTGGHLETVGTIIDGLLLDSSEWASPSPAILDFISARARAKSTKGSCLLPTRFTAAAFAEQVEALHAAVCTRSLV
jgi:glycosyltransferase involved in cell wall biosynthesis